MKITKENCIAHIASGNPQAIEYIVEEYGDLIKTVLCRSLGQHRQHWEECFNDVLMAVWKTGGSFDGSKGSMTSWLAAVAKHKAVDFLRKEVRHDNRAEALTEPAVYDEYSGETVIDELLECLCEEDRELFRRRYVYEQTAEEITASTGLKRDVVYSRLSRGRKKFAKLWKKGVQADEGQI